MQSRIILIHLPGFQKVSHLKFEVRSDLEHFAREVPTFPGKICAALPEDTADKAQEWAEKEGERGKFMEGIADFNKDPRAALDAMSS